MTTDNSIDNVIARLSGEHKLIADYVVRFSKGVAQQDEAFFSKLHEFFDFLKKDLLRHFEMEELVFFPAAVDGAASYDTTLMVLHFQKEHGILEKELEWMLEQKHRFAPGQTDAALIETVTHFFERLKVHAKRELIELFPLIDADRRCKAMVKRYLEEFRTG